MVLLGISPQPTQSIRLAKFTVAHADKCGRSPCACGQLLSRGRRHNFVLRPAAARDATHPKHMIARTCMHSFNNSMVARLVARILCGAGYAVVSPPAGAGSF